LTIKLKKLPKNPPVGDFPKSAKIAVAGGLGQVQK
jgi:hypothetical protein